MPKRKAKDEPGAKPDWSDREKAENWPWIIFPLEDGTFCILASGPALRYGEESDKVLVCTCPTKEIARYIVSNRQIAEAATNWIGLIFRVIAQALMGPEARGYRDAWRRAGVPLESEDYLERAMDYSPLHPPDPPEY